MTNVGTDTATARPPVCFGPSRLSAPMPAMALTAKGGRVVQTAIAPLSQTEVSLNLFELAMYEKQLVGSIFGSANPRRDIPRLLRLHQEGQLKLEELITRTYPLEKINEGYQDMRDGKNIRGMVMYDHSS